METNQIRKDQEKEQLWFIAAFCFVILFGFLYSSRHRPYLGTMVHEFGHWITAFVLSGQMGTIDIHSDGGGRYNYQHGVSGFTAFMVYLMGAGFQIMAAIILWFRIPARRAWKLIRAMAPIMLYGGLQDVCGGYLTGNRNHDFYEYGFWKMVVLFLISGLVLWWAAKRGRKKSSLWKQFKEQAGLGKGKSDSSSPC